MALHYVLYKHLALLTMQVSRQELSRQLLILNENFGEGGKNAAFMFTPDAEILLLWYEIYP